MKDKNSVELTAKDWVELLIILIGVGSLWYAFGFFGALGLIFLSGTICKAVREASKKDGGDK